MTYEDVAINNALTKSRQNPEARWLAAVFQGKVNIPAEASMSGFAEYKNHFAAQRFSKLNQVFAIPSIIDSFDFTRSRLQQPTRHYEPFHQPYRQQRRDRTPLDRIHQRPRLHHYRQPIHA